MECLALHADLSLRDFCGKFQAALHLPDFRFDYENETEWALTEINNIEYNISRPYEAATLREWDNTVPEECNFGITLCLLSGHASPNHEWAFEKLVGPVARVVADEFAARVYYHRSWIGPGRNIPRSILYQPNEA
jgi:hypothetical protein